MKVVHVVRQYHPSVGGMEDVVRNLCAYQLNCGDRPRILTLNRLFRKSQTALPAEEEVDGVPVRRLPFFGPSRYALCPVVVRHLEDCEVVHVHGVDFFYDYLAATKLIHRRRLVASTHGGFFHTSFASGLKKAYFQTITRAASGLFDRVIASSRNDGEMFAGLVAARRLEVIENGVDVEKFHDRAAAEPQRTLIYFGRWSANKGLLEALHLFHKLQARDPRWRLIIAGREYDYDRRSLGLRVAELKLSEKVMLVPNPPYAELAELLGQASYFVGLSRHEGFGLAAVEAMSAGLIPLLSDIPPFRRLVECSGVGLLVAADTKAQPTAVETLLELHASGRVPFDRRRAQEFAARYSWRHAAARYREVYRSLTERAAISGGR